MAPSIWREEDAKLMVDEWQQAWGLVKVGWDLAWLPSLVCCPADYKSHSLLR